MSHSPASTPPLPSWFTAPHDSRPDLLAASVRYIHSTNPAKYQWTGIYILESTGQTLVLGPYIGDPTDHTRIPVGRGVCGTAVATGEDQVVEDVSQLSNYLACSTKTRSELVVLIRSPDDGSILGQVDIDSHSKGAFGPSEVDLVRRVAAEVGALWGRYGPDRAALVAQTRPIDAQ